MFDKLETIKGVLGELETVALNGLGSSYNDEQAQFLIGVCAYIRQSVDAVVNEQRRIEEYLAGKRPLTVQMKRFSKTQHPDHKVRRKLEDSIRKLKRKKVS